VTHGWGKLAWDLLATVRSSGCEDVWVGLLSLAGKAVGHNKQSPRAHVLCPGRGTGRVLRNVQRSVAHFYTRAYVCGGVFFSFSCALLVTAPAHMCRCLSVPVCLSLSVCVSVYLGLRVQCGKDVVDESVCE